MVGDKAAQLQSEIVRLARALNREPVQVGVIRKDDDVNIFIDAEGKYHYSYWERGREHFDRVGDMDDVLYWFAQGITADIGSGYSARHSDENQNYRRVMWARQYEVLSQLNPQWAKRCVRELADKLRGWGFDKDVELLPDIPERNITHPPDPR